MGIEEVKKLELKKYDDGIKPESWLLSPKAVRTFILGSNKPLVYRNKEVKITKKFFGFGDQNEGSQGLKILGFIIAIIGGLILFFVR